MVSIVSQSFHVKHDRVIVEVENCGPFGCKKEMMVDMSATEEIRRREPLGKFVGLSNYLDNKHLATGEISRSWAQSESWGEFISAVFNLKFYQALAFTLTYTIVVTPFVIILGFFIALAVNSLNKHLKGPVIFLSLLPMIVTPLVGSLILFWMIDSRGIIGWSLQYIFDDPELSLKASTALTWITLCVYGVWHGAPFAFIVLYAGLQTLPKDTLESAMIDGASKWEQTRYVTVPHLMPLVTFVALMQFMDNFRVFEPIVGFNAEAHAQSLSYSIYSDLRDQVQLTSSAAVTSVITIIGLFVLLSPVLIRTWRDFQRKA